MTRGRRRKLKLFLPQEKMEAQHTRSTEPSVRCPRGRTALQSACSYHTPYLTHISGVPLPRAPVIAVSLGHWWHLYGQHGSPALRTIRASISSSSCLPFSTRVTIWLLRVFTSLDSTLLRDRMPSNFFFCSSSSVWRVSRSLVSFCNYKMRAESQPRLIAQGTLNPTLWGDSGLGGQL